MMKISSLLLKSRLLRSCGVCLLCVVLTENHSWDYCSAKAPADKGHVGVRSPKGALIGPRIWPFRQKSQRQERISSDIDSWKAVDTDTSASDAVSISAVLIALASAIISDPIKTKCLPGNYHRYSFLHMHHSNHSHAKKHELGRETAYNLQLSFAPIPAGEDPVFGGWRKQALWPRDYRWWCHHDNGAFAIKKIL
ncbi:uncharacterized protein YALI1_F33473g [Yarrowia lipolytica]|uniref:Uncharacterized protein n=1 Tax=Yarrowia lipolytica TaxID=4952 RepID=A0A1D8NQ24_YARLL|nr:hypothetical protein YALI1_F33473g [Yarrowia lipolytica]